MQYSRLSTQKVNRILLCFCEDITATAAAKLVRVNRNTVNNYYNAIREKILAESLKEMSADGGEFEADESYFGARRVRGRRGRGATGKTPVFGLLKRGGRVFVKAVENCSREELMPVIQGKVKEGNGRRPKPLPPARTTPSPSPTSAGSRPSR